MIDALDKVIAQMPADVKVIPGHGPASNLEDMRAFVKMRKEARAAAQSALERRETLDQMLQAKQLSPWKRYNVHSRRRLLSLKRCTDRCLLAKTDGHYRRSIINGYCPTH